MAGHQVWAEAEHLLQHAHAQARAAEARDQLVEHRDVRVPVGGALRDRREEAAEASRRRASHSRLQKRGQCGGSVPHLQLAELRVEALAVRDGLAAHEARQVGVGLDAPVPQ